MRIRWAGLGPRLDPWGKEYRRFYQLETLTNAIEWSLKKRIGFLPAVLYPNGETTPLTFTLVHEGPFQLTFRVVAGAASTGGGAYRLVVAKNHEELSRTLRTDYANLQLLSDRLGESVLRPMRAGKFFLPDRHGRKAEGREVHAYLAPWPSGRRLVLPAGNDQFAVEDGGAPRVLTKPVSEAIKTALVELVAKTYHPRKRTALAVPDVAAGHVAAALPKEAPPRLLLLHAPTLLERVTPADLLREMVRARVQTARGTIRLTPADPAEFVAALVRAVGVPQAREWLEQYRVSREDRSTPGGYLSDDVVHEVLATFAE